MSPQPNRLDWIDALRGIAMLLIVVGHSLIGLMNAQIIAPEGWARGVILFIYQFHMPIIFFVSGYVSKDTRKTPPAFARNMAQWLLLPYILWSLILVSIQNSFGGANAPLPYSDLAFILWKPISIFWFLYALLIIKSIDYTSARLLPAPKTLLIEALLGAAGFMFLPSSLLGKILGCLFFYATGRLLAEKPAAFALLTNFIERTPVRKSLIAALSLTALLATTVFYTTHADKLQPLSEPQALFLLTGIIGLCFSYIVVRNLSMIKLTQSFVILGVYSMAIYVQHTIWGSALRSVFVKLHTTNTPTLLILIVGLSLVAPIIWQKIADRLRVTRYFGIRPVNHN